MTDDHDKDAHLPLVRAAVYILCLGLFCAIVISCIELWLIPSLPPMQDLPR